SVARLTLNNSQVTGNQQTAGPPDNGLGGGGIVSMLGTVTLNSSQVNANSAPNAGGGGIQNLLGSVTLNSSQVNGNTSLNGGGIASGNGNGGLPPGTSHLVLNKSQVD